MTEADSSPPDRRGRPIPLAEALQLVRSFPDSISPPFEITLHYGDSDDQDAGLGKQRRKSVKWSPEEQQFVINGYCRFGPLWTEILKEYPFHPHRIHTDLRDKWNNILRHSHDEPCARLFANVTGCLQRREIFLTAREGAATEAAVNPFPILQHIRAEVRRATGGGDAPADGAPFIDFG
jgi:hypothetical protein